MKQIENMCVDIKESNQKKVSIMKKLNKKSSAQQLDDVKQGDLIKDDTGKAGEVENIEILNRKKETQYYYKLKHDGTILVIK